MSQQARDSSVASWIVEAVPHTENCFAAILTASAPAVAKLVGRRLPRVAAEELVAAAVNFDPRIELHSGNTLRKR